MKIKETILIFVEIGKHMKTFSFTDIVDHIVLEELVDVVRRNLSQLHSIDTLAGCPRLKSVLLGELLSLFLDDLFVLRN